MAVHPVIARAVEAAARIPAPDDESPEAWRARALSIDWEVTRPLMTPAPPCAVRDVEAPVRGRPPVRVRLYSPVGRNPRGALLYFFGGAFRQGGPHFPSSDIVNRSRAARAEVVVAAVDYSLAPEATFPAPVEEGAAALAWLASHAHDLGFSPNEIAIGGLSAGANIAASVALANRDANGSPIRLQLLETPVLDLTGERFRPELAAGLGVPEQTLEQSFHEMTALYLNGADPRDPRASPLRAPSFDGLPPTHVFTAELDAFRGDAEAFVEALDLAGAPVHEHRYAGMTHDSHFFDRVLPDAAAWQHDVVRLLRTIGTA